MTKHEKHLQDLFDFNKNYTHEPINNLKFKIVNSNDCFLQICIINKRDDNLLTHFIIDENITNYVFVKMLEMCNKLSNLLYIINN